MKNMEIDTKHFSLMKIMADRDFEIESRLNSDSFVEDLKEHYDIKYYEDVYDWTHSYIKEDIMITMPRERGKLQRLA